MYYAEYFRLNEAPFSIAPNPRYLFMSERHREALAHLLYGVVNGNGFVALTGEVGTGKTTLCNCLLDQLPDNVDLALILNPRVNAEELLATLCDELGIDYPEGTTSLKVLVDALNAHLLKVHANGRNTVLLIDEAQNLSIDVLEQIRLLSNLETRETKLLQIILVGQPELNQLLAQNNLRQLNQRITARFHIEPLSQQECLAYIEHRLRVAGASHPVFSRRAVKKIFRWSGGIPRLINIICDRAMLGAYSTGVHRVEPTVVNKAAREVLLDGISRNNRPGYWKGLLAMVVIGAVTGFYFFGLPEKPPLSLSQRSKVEFKPPKPYTAHHIQTGTSLDQNYQEIFSDLVPAAEAGLRFDSTDRTVTLPNRFVREQVLPIKEVTPKEVLSVASALDMVAVKHEPASGSGRQRVRFIDMISNPKLNLYAALPQLFMEWNITNEPRNKNFCKAARRSGLRCLVQHGTWHYLLTLNRPATLEFSLRKGIIRYATLTGVSGEYVTFRFLDDKPVSFPISEVLPYWQGQFALLWKPPAPNTALLMRGYSNPAVVWLRESLPSTPGQNIEPSSSVYFDQNLEDRVIAFQSNNHLNSDGKVGSETIMLINTVNGPSNIPKLYANVNQSCPTC